MLVIVVYKIEKRYIKLMLSVLNFIEIRCILNVNVKYIMYLYISLIWFVWVYYLIMKIYKFWYWFFFFIKLFKRSVFVVFGEN